jgi:crotonobetainyl-CoA:carnitine CoA-transferase CaiB-like acyl-CoA transferase
MKRPGHGTQFDALSGSILLDEKGEPITHPVPLGDMSGALYATTSIIAALLHRELTGEGQRIDVPLSGAVMSLMAGAAGQVLRERDQTRRSDRGGDRRPLTFLKCKDGKWITTSNSETIFWENFCKVLNHPEWVPLYRRQGPEAEAMYREVEALFLTRPRAEWLDILSKAETCVAPVNNIAEAMEDPQMRHIGMVWQMQHPIKGKVQQLGFPVRYSSGNVQPGTFAPYLGQHTRDILSEAGYSSAEIEGFEKSGAVKSWQGK